MHLDTNLAGICDGCHVRCDDCCDSCLLRCVEGASHILKILVVEDDVEGEIGLDTVFRAYTHDLVKVSHLEVVGGVRTHVELLNTEVYGVCTSLYRSMQTFKIARRGHDL